MLYLKVWTSFRADISALGDAEKGRLFVAMLEYAEDGREPEFSGNERIIWPIAKRTIDLAAKKNERLRQNGENGGRPKTKENQTKPNETKEEENGVLVSPLYIKDKDKDKVKDKEKDKEKEKRDEYIAQVFALLNQRTGKHFRATGQSRRFVNARLAEGYTLEDFADVIDKKCAEWLGTDMEKYLRPETLFGSKFDGYLNEPVKRHKSGGSSSWSFEDFAAEPQGDENRVYVEPEDTEGGFPF